METNPELSRVLENPDHVILSDSLKEILGDDTRGDNVENKFSGEVLQGENSLIIGDILSIKKEPTQAEITLKTSRKSALNLAFKNGLDDLTFKVKDSDYSLVGNILKTNIVSLIDSSKVELSFFMRITREMT